jgi:orotidine-5'-phosphate decarboxylase
VADGPQTVAVAPPPPTGTLSSGRTDLTGFGDQLAGCVQRRRSQIVLGLDPDPARLWPEALVLGGESGSRPPRPLGAAERAARAVAAHCRLVLDAAAEQCVAVKPQVACFERLGAPGWAALREVIHDAAQRGLMVIADA